MKLSDEAKLRIYRNTLEWYKQTRDAKLPVQERLVDDLERKIAEAKA